MRVFIMVLLLVGCSSRREFTAYGSVQSYWCLPGGTCEAVFEHDTGEVQSLTFLSPPPMWVGEHLMVHYYDDEGGASHVIKTVRLK